MWKNESNKYQIVNPDFLLTGSLLICSFSKLGFFYLIHILNFLTKGLINMDQFYCQCVFFMVFYGVP